MFEAKKGDFVGLDNGPIALVLGNRVPSTFLGSQGNKGRS